MTDDEAVMLKIKINLFQEFNKIIKFEKSVINSV